MGDLGSIPELRRSPGEGHGNPLQYSGLENPMDYTVHGTLEARIMEWAAFFFPSPGDLPNSGIEPRSPTLWADSLPAEPLGTHISTRGRPKERLEAGRARYSLLRFLCTATRAETHRRTQFSQADLSKQPRLQVLAPAQSPSPFSGPKVAK